MPSNGALDQQILDFSDRPRRIEPFWTDINAIHDRVTTEQPVRVFQIIKTFVNRLVARIGDKTIRLQQPRWADKFIRVPPE